MIAARHIVWTLAVAVWATPAPSAQERTSLEAFLANARAQREQLLATMTIRVQELVAGLEANSGGRADAWIEKLVDLGPEATPAMVPWIDPGAAATNGHAHRARHVASALRRMETSAVTGELLAIAGGGSPLGRENAVHVLGSSPDAVRVRPALEAEFETATGPLKRALLRSLLELGEGGAQPLIERVLSGEDNALIELALESMADSGMAALAPQVNALLADHPRAASVAPSILLYYRALPQVVSDQQVGDLTTLAQRADIALETRSEIVESIPGFDPPLNAQLRKSLEPIVESANPQLKESGLMTLAILGDRASRRNLLQNYNQEVQRNDTFAPAYLNRAHIYRRLGEFDRAISDYKDALRYGRNKSSLGDIHVGLARCYAQKNRLKDARENLLLAPLSVSERRKLADDPDFAKLRESSRYGDVFGD